MTPVSSPRLSLWQSAVDEIVARRQPGRRPDADNRMVRQATAHCLSLHSGRSALARKPDFASGPAVTVDIAYCSMLALRLAEAKLFGDRAAADRYSQELTNKFTKCDTGWSEVIDKYIEFVLQGGSIPYRRHSSFDDFVVEPLPATARIALVGDWGTGQPEARSILEQIKRKNPDAVVHLGDIYYSGTDYEVENWFLAIWRQTLDLTSIRTFTLSGNHDMYSGGAAYYGLIDTLGQPASYFALRNDYWQFLSMDTGLHDSQPGGGLTYLEDSEIDWLRDKLDNSGGRATILLSHHPLFTSSTEPIVGRSVNDILYSQIAPLLPSVTAWFWGHEHDLVIYGNYLGVRARCLGHGALPVGLDELPVKPKFPEVPRENIHLDAGSAFYKRGYAIVDLDGPAAVVSYYEDGREDTPLYSETLTSNG